jgi:2-methylcitrate dehydratase PrpD
VTGATEAVARFAVESDPLGSSPGVARPARSAILDTLGVALAGAREPVAEIIARYTLSQGGPSAGEPGACSLWARDAATTAQLAALANGAAAHALDFDDISHSMRGRPSAAVLPAVLALGERLHASGAAVLAAYVVGVEVECKLGVLSANPTYERGWQTSCTLGVIGATAGCGRLLGLDVAQMTHAIGLAVVQASGSRRSFGSMGKPFQVGRASQSAVIGAELAALGLTGGARAIEGEAGYFALYSNPTPGEELAGLLGAPFDLESPGFNVKLYPCGGAAHAPIEAVFEAAKGVDPASVERIIVDVPFTAPMIAHQNLPTTGLEGKFSLQYVLAAAMLDGEVTLAQFTDEAVNRPAAQALLRRVETRVPPDMQRGAVPWPPAVESRAELHLRGGEVRRGVTVVRRGQSTLTPLTDAELEAKFRSCARIGLSDAGAERVLALVRTLDQLDDVGTLTAALASPPEL